MVEMGIKYSSYLFSEPQLLTTWCPPPWAAIYAILVPCVDWRPRPFRVLYFGQTTDLSERFRWSHHAYWSWVCEAGPWAGLYVAVYPMFDSSEEQRRLIEGLLIDWYRPTCN